MPKLPDGVFAPEAISSREEIALQFQNHQIRGRAPLKLSKAERGEPHLETPRAEGHLHVQLPGDVESPGFRQGEETPPLWISHC